MTTEAAPLPRGPSRRRWMIAAAIAIAVVVAALVGLLPRIRSRAGGPPIVQPHAVAPPVAVTTAVSLGLTRDLELPANLVGMQRTTIYARASGYVRRWYADIGQRVRPGDLLAELDTPELDQQLAQARSTLAQRLAALKQAEADSAYLQVTAQRALAMYQQNVGSKQAADQAVAQAKVGEANVAAAKANVAAQEAAIRQLEQLIAYARVTAPFAGTITRRFVDVGSLVNAGAAQGSALFQLEATDPLRAFVEVPQTFAPSVRVGVDATIKVRQYPDRSFPGKVTRSAGALDPATRTLRTELQVPNSAGELFPGMAAVVTLPVAVSHPVVRIPSSAPVFDASGVHVAVVDPNDRVALVPVQPGRDNGTEVEIVDGLQGGERVVVSPPAGLTTGMQVQPTLAPAADAGATDAGADGD